MGSWRRFSLSLFGVIMNEIKDLLHRINSDLAFLSRIATSKAFTARQNIASLKNKITSDKLLKNYTTLINQPEMEAVVSNLLPKVKSRLMAYNLALQEYENSYSSNVTMSGFWDLFSTKDQAAIDQADHDTGVRLFTAYFDEASKYPAFSSKYSSIDDYLSHLEKGDAVTTAGSILRNSNLSTDENDSVARLIELANSHKGEALDSVVLQTIGGHYDTLKAGAFVSAAGGQLVEDIGAKAVEVASGITDITQNVGAGLLSTGKVLRYLPWVLGAAGIIYIASNAYFSKARKSSSSTSGEGLRARAKKAYHALRGST